ncbi:hypothetical protein [Burkholderia anthina]|uniref:hypothetical protein n=1 Tax=Burkholderia anthina TaxID=179879 RepID=UPI00158881AF|nr:hypothetical protein [Burkholderia anthina]
MWICFNDAFLSIVSDPASADTLLVRARRHGDIEAVFGGDVMVVTLPGRDYQFRASISRAAVGDVVAASLRDIDYGNFKNSVKDANLHDAYATVWGVMADLQEIPPYRSSPRRGFMKRPVR